MDNKDLLQTALEAAFAGPALDEARLARSFSPDYRQWTNGKTLDYAQFVNHLRTLRETAAVEIRILHCMAEGERIFSLHQARATLRDGHVSTHRVLALFRIENGRVVECDELTFMQEGQPADRDLGVRTDH